MEEPTTRQEADRLIRAFVQFRRLRFHGVKADKGPGEKLRHSDYLVLFTIHEYEEKHPEGASVTELSALMGVKPPTVTAILGHLEREHLIQREMDLNDRRIVRVRLEENARQFARNARQNFEERIEGLVLHLGQEKARQLADILNDVFIYAEEISHDGCPDGKSSRL